MPGNGTYRSAEAFRSAVDTRLRSQARRGGRPFAESRREFLYQRFLARVFLSDTQWALKGGVGLLVRLETARHSRDIDLLSLNGSTALAEAELQEIGRVGLGDFLRFEVVRSVPLSIVEALRIKMDVYVGASRWESFDVDVSCERHFVAALEEITPSPVLELAGMAALPKFVLYPLEDQIADKVAAMYERHHGAPSSRYRDLVDLALIVGAFEFDGMLLQKALRVRETHSRNPLTLPSKMELPGPGWRAGYAGEARRSSLSKDLHAVEAALGYVGECLDEVLTGIVVSGRWKPGAGWAGLPRAID